MPPWNPIFEHLCSCHKIISTLPKDAHPEYLPDMIRRHVPDLGPVCYIDNWPFGAQMLAVASPRGLHQITQGHSLPKYHVLKSFLEPITEGLDIVTVVGDRWKPWRGGFQPRVQRGSSDEFDTYLCRREWRGFVVFSRSVHQTRRCSERRI